MRRVCLLLTIAACGRLGFEQHAVETVDAGVEPPRCGTTVLLDDSFTDATAAPLFVDYTQNGMSVSETGGAVSFVFAANVGAGRYSGYDSATLYPSQDFCATVEVTEIPTGEGLGYFNLVGGTQKIEFIVYRGKVELRTVTSGAPTGVGIFPFDPVTQRFWRLRQQAGVTYWDISADNVDFETLAMMTFFSQPMAKVAIGAGAVMTATNAERFTVQHVTMTGP